MNVLNEINICIKRILMQNKMFKFRLSQQQKQLLNSKAKALNMNSTQFFFYYFES